MPRKAVSRLAGTYGIAVASLLGLIGLCVAWELWLAPLRPGGSWIVLKAVPLLAPLRGVLHGRTYTMQWASLLVLLYLAEGLTRGVSESGLSAALAFGEALLAGVFIIGAGLYVRESGRQATP